MAGVDKTVPPDNNDVVTSIIRIRVNDHFTNVLLDSGANTSVVNLAFVKALGIPLEPLGPNSLKVLIAADSRTMKVLGEVTLSFKIDSLQIFHRFSVLKGLSTNVICGMDFIRINQINCNHADGTAWFQKERIGVPFIRQQNYIGIAYLSQSIVVPPQTEELLPVNCRTKIPKGENIVLQSLNPICNNITVIQTNTIANDVLHVRIRNNSTGGVKLRKFGPICAVVRANQNNSTGQAYHRLSPMNSNIPDDTHPDIDFSIPTSDQTLGTTPIRRPPMENSCKNRTFQDLKLKLGNAISSEEEAKPFQDLITEFNDCFALSNTELTGCKLAECSFELKDPGSKPIRSRSYPLSASDRLELERQVRQMEKMGSLRNC